ncbi:MAG TPA: GatB/YqeY domain-containing protein [Candidatus Hydrogenedentes bacterium]|nr:GatB/YqeY domain-containing protein [Candidatus Hydrogenedentota bacterium]
MSIKQAIQEAMKEAMKNKDHDRLECLRMAKGALLLKEKEGPKGDIEDADAVAALRAEIKKRQHSIETFRSVGQEEAAKKTEIEIAIIEEFLPKQLSAGQLEERVRAYLAEHPELNHAGKLTGAIKKELGDLADGKMLNEICRAVLGQ